jgi:hypothetical protein
MMGLRFTFPEHQELSVFGRLVPEAPVQLRSRGS